jgi:hypothetical protein
MSRPLLCRSVCATIRTFENCQPVPKEPLIKSTMNRVADKNGMIARRATQVVVILRCQGAQHREHPFLLQPVWALALRAACGVRLLAKGMTIRFVAFLAMPSRHVTAQQPIAGARAGRPSRTKRYAPPCPACDPAKPSARPCGT